MTVFEKMIQLLFGSLATPAARRLGRFSKERFTLVNDFQTKGPGRRSGRSATRRDLIRERTKAGLAAARARGRISGRPKGLTPEAQAKARAVKSM